MLLRQEKYNIIMQSLPVIMIESEGLNQESTDDKLNQQIEILSENPSEEDERLDPNDLKLDYEELNR